MQPHHMVEEIGENLSEPEKNKAYALALEVCAANFEMHFLWKQIFLNLLEEQWGITRNDQGRIAHLSRTPISKIKYSRSKKLY